MGKVGGFLEFDRQVPDARAPRERLQDWREFHGHLPEERLRQQGARCMDCGTPFCHYGQILAGAASGCPLNNLIPEWNDLVYRGKWREALQRLLSTNNFPEITGRVCPAPCEGSCVLGINEPPVTIKNIELAIIEKGFAEGWMRPTLAATRTGKKVVVVGSGPAGLACAAQLSSAGHQVTVLERDDRIGGLLMYGIPNMKLDKRGVVERRVQLMRDEGIEFRPGVELGKDVSLDDLRREYDAVVLTIGAGRPRDLTVDGRQLSGVHFAMEFLRGNTKSLLDSELRDGRAIPAKDHDVLVIGGGDTGTDCVATSLRHGCRSLVQFEILPRPPAERAADNPWPQWPRVYKMDYGQEEAASVLGADPRRYCVVTKRLVGDDQGRVKEAHTVEVEWVTSADGRRSMRDVPGTEKVWPATLVLLALGFVGPDTAALQAAGIGLDARGNIATDEDRRTSVDGIFAAGDAVRGQSLVVWAIREGRAAAKGVDRFLMGETQLP